MKILSIRFLGLEQPSNGTIPNNVIVVQVHENWCCKELGEGSVLFLTEEQKEHLKVKAEELGVNLKEIGQGTFFPAKECDVATLPPMIEIRMSNLGKCREALELICSVSDFPVGPSPVLRIMKDVNHAGEPTYSLVGEPPS